MITTLVVKLLAEWILLRISEWCSILVLLLKMIWLFVYRSQEVWWVTLLLFARDWNTAAKSLILIVLHILRTWMEFEQRYNHFDVERLDGYVLECLDSTLIVLLVVDWEMSAMFSNWGLIMQCASQWMYSKMSSTTTWLTVEEFKRRMKLRLSQGIA